MNINKIIIPKVGDCYKIDKHKVMIIDTDNCNRFRCMDLSSFKNYSLYKSTIKASDRISRKKSFLLRDKNSISKEDDILISYGLITIRYNKNFSFMLRYGFDCDYIRYSEDPSVSNFISVQGSARKKLLKSKIKAMREFVKSWHLEPQYERLRRMELADVIYEYLSKSFIMHEAPYGLLFLEEMLRREDSTFMKIVKKLIC